jgi:uncharacterized protein YabE (DUF348 family)
MTKTKTFLASLKVGDTFRFLNGKPENNYTVLYTDHLGTLYRSNLYKDDTFFVPATERREVTLNIKGSRSEITTLVNQVIDLCQQQNSLLQKIDALGGRMYTRIKDAKLIAEAYDAQGRPIKVTP